MTPSPDALPVHERLASLEARLAAHDTGRRRWRRLATISMACVLLGVLAGGAAIREHLMEARAFILRDTHGTMRGSFVVSDDGGVRLTMFDTSRTAKAGVWLEPSGRATIWGFDNLGSASETTAMQPAPMTVQHTPVTPYVHAPSPQFAGTNIVTGPQTTAMPNHAPAQTVSYQSQTPWQFAGAPTGALLMLNSSARVLEKQHTHWTCGYQVTVRNDARQPVEQAYYVTFVDQDGFVLARQARMVRLAPYQQTMLNGEIEISPERAAQIAHVRLSAWTP